MSKSKRRKRRAKPRQRSFCIVFGNRKQGRRHIQDKRGDPFKTRCGKDLLANDFIIRYVTKDGRCEKCYRLSRPKGGGTVEIFGEEQVDQIVHMYVEEKMSLNEISAEMYSQKTTIKRYLLKRGVKLRPRGGAHNRAHTALDDRIEEIEWLYWAYGMSINQVAAHMGLTPSAVQSRMARHNIPRRKQTHNIMNGKRKVAA
jgi:hypothetical protein